MKRSILLSLVISVGALQALAFKQADLDKLLRTKICQKCDLQKAQLKGANLERANLESVSYTHLTLPTKRIV